MSQKSISNTFAILSKMITFYFLVVYIERKQRRWGVGGVILCMVGVLLTFKKPENYIFAVKNKDYSKRWNQGRWLYDMDSQWTLGRRAPTAPTDQCPTDQCPTDQWPMYQCPMDQWPMDQWPTDQWMHQFVSVNKHLWDVEMDGHLQQMSPLTDFQLTQILI